jgi:hypothetical protein
MASLTETSTVLVRLPLSGRGFVWDQRSAAYRNRELQVHESVYLTPSTGQSCTETHNTDVRGLLSSCYILVALLTISEPYPKGRRLSGEGSWGRRTQLI